MAILNTLSYNGISPDLIIVRHLIECDGVNNNTNFVIYDSAAVAALLAKTDPKSCTLMFLRLYGSRPASNSVPATFKWIYAASAPQVATIYATGGTGDFCCIQDWKYFGGMPNLANGTAGATGNVLLTTGGTAASDRFHVLLGIRPY